ncbi:hypothetical protein DM860_002410 [Cuscuta australis]|uniref:PHD-type domain-containing protein n=1 Tax=Cuscuta australis TaxID=267555 RepID=A0A328CYA6_9ASTE|nr:hypothetical protein DM860_002410 [Cuscuta australis]
MEGSVRSVGVVKKRSSSGCLIIKKKDDRVGGMGMGGIHPSGSYQRDSKRARMVMHDSDSSDEFPEPVRRRAGESSHLGPVMYRSGEIERKRNRLGVFEFNETMRNGYQGERLAMEFENKPIRNVMAEQRKHSYFDSSGSSKVSSGRTRGACYGDEEVHFPIPLMKLKYQAASDEPIRLQGKNGVLKVMVNKIKKMDFLHNNESRNVENRKTSMPEHFSEPRVQQTLYADSKSTEMEKYGLKSQISFGEESTSTADSDTEGTHTSHKSTPPSSFAAVSSIKGVKEEEARPPAPETASVVNKEGKVKRGGSTEKQQLRERIRGMLIKAGWTIDYRPRKNRDYLDAVYISPNGTAYWSIIKAYDAFQKHLEDSKKKSDGNSPPFAPLSADLINKLTRQTRKKIEKEMKKKKIDESMSSRDNKVMSLKVCAEGIDHHDERLDIYGKKNCKQVNGLFHTTNQTDEYYNSLKSGRNLIPGKKSQITGRCTLLVRSSDIGKHTENGDYVPYSGKRTLLSWMIDSGTVKLSEKVQYMSRKKSRIKLEGWITRDGIHCGCCSKILTVSKFELHAGSKLRQPFQNIVLESGVSLLQCLVNSWNRQKESECRDYYAIGIDDDDDPADDACGICGDGGDLICCDGCPSTFHQSCLGIKMLPLGDWHCPNCICKFCGAADENHAEVNKDANKLLICNLCERKYHRSCRQEKHALSMNANTLSTFCGQACQEIYDHLQKILGVKHELESGLSWSLLQRSELDYDTSHLSFSQRVECNSKLAIVLSVMDECFMPIVDRRSEINIIHNVVYNCGSNFSRLNYHGFYTAILERGDEIISAACIRIRGAQLAEMPFIGTRHMYRHQGMCRRLFSSIEEVLSSLRVEKLIIPAVPDHIHTWTMMFGFKKLEESDKHEVNSMNMLVFPGIHMLQKQLVKQESSDAASAFQDRNGVEAFRSNLDTPISPNLKRSLTLGSSQGIEAKAEGGFFTRTAPGSALQVSAKFCAAEKECNVSHPSSKMCFQHDLNLQADLI